MRAEGARGVMAALKGVGIEASTPICMTSSVYSVGLRIATRFGGELHSAFDVSGCQIRGEIF